MKRLPGLMLCAALLAGCERPAPPPQPPRPALVVTAGVSAGSAPTILVGEVRSRYETAQGFRIDGKIVERRVEVGSVVKKGQVLARLDAADAGLSAMAARAGVAAAEADLALAQTELDRQRKLYQRQFVSGTALDMQEAQFKSAQARLDQARAQAAVAGNQSGYTEMRADRDGVITGIRAEPGQVVEAGEAVVFISVPSAMEVAVAVPESRMAGIVVGMPAEIRLWANREASYRGKVREIAPAADSATRTFQVRVAFEQEDAALHLGMTAGVRFLREDQPGFLLPAAAISQYQGKNVVWVVDPKTRQVQPRPVRTGAYVEDGVLVTQGLAGGEQIVAAGVHALTPGLTVRPVAVESSR